MRFFALMSAVSLVALANTASAQGAGTGSPASGSTAAPQDVPDAISDIIVTAQKRSDRLRDVPLSINAASGEQLKSAGITSTADLEKIVPGFVQQQSAFGNPVFFIRGVGFNDTTLGVAPAVSIYMDQQPLSFSSMARGAVLDLERVEVLKGPQGTLFGQNSTGGAINYIAAKPTRELKAGFDLTYGRFGQADAEAYISGPLSDTLAARVAVRSENRNEWQKGYTISEKLGSKRFLNGRLSLRWEPTDAMSVLLTANAWRDRSDAQQPQFIAYTPLVPVGGNPVPFPISTFPLAPHNARAAAWDPSFDYKLDNWLYQFSGDIEVDLSDAVHLASLTSYAKFGQSVPINFSGTQYPNAFSVGEGKIETFSQELRLNGDVGDSVKWMVGANYKWDKVIERLHVGPLVTTGAGIGPFPFTSYRDDNDQRIKSKSVFGSLDYKITEQLTLQGSIRYTQEDRDFQGCTRDSGNGELAAGVSFLTGLFGNPQTIAPSACAMMDGTGVVLPIIKNSLNEDNVSWRASLNWKPNRDTLIYANITKGYKSGNFPTIPGVVASQMNPIKQESVLAYEVGTKLSLQRSVQVTGAAFYYDYKDKQLLGNRQDPIFGPLFGLVPIPKSHVAGMELSLVVGPFSGFTLSLNGTYVHSRVSSEPVVVGGQPLVGPFGDVATFAGQSFPLSPKWQGSADAQYRTSISSKLNGFAGITATGRTGANGQLLSYNASVAALEKLLKIKGYVLVDLHAGIETRDKQWQVEFWGRNIFNQFYTNGNTRNSDFVTQFTGMPATYGVSLKYRM